MILVTGGCGFIGSALVKALVASGHKVRVFDNGFRGDDRRLKDVNHENIVGDIRDRDAVIDASEGCAEIIHLAFINGTENFYKAPAVVLEVGVKGICNVVDACLINKIPNVLLASSSEVYQSATEVPTTEKVPLIVPDPYNARYSYGAGKIISEMMAIHTMDRFEKMIIVRPHNIYGPDMGRDHVIPQMAERIKSKGELVFYGQEPQETMNGERIFWGAAQTRSFCYISDAVNGIMIARERGAHGQIYNVGNEDEIPIIDLARKIAAHGKCPLKFVSMDGPVAVGGAQRRCPDISKIAELGYRQTVTLDDGLQKTLEWYWQ